MAASLLFSLGACGSTALTEVFSSRGDGGAASIDAAATDAAGDGATANSDAGGRSDGATRSDGAVPDSGTPDVGTPGVPLGCAPADSLECNPATEACCRKSDTYSCIPRNQSCGGGVKIPCSEASHCTAGNVCCGQTAPSGTGISVVTSAICASPSFCDSGGRVVICNPNDADPCPVGGNCTESTATLPGFFLCLN